MKNLVRMLQLKTLAWFALLLTVAPVWAGVTVTYFHNDFAGSPVMASDSNGNIVWKETYLPYGERLVESSASSGNAIWFTGRPQDPDSDLVYMGARYYDPAIGRFLGVDPMAVDFGDLHTFNRYAYANNNPYRFVDPTGLSAQAIEGVTVTGHRDEFEPGLWDFWLNATRELELTYGEDSWAVAFWNVTAGGFSEATADAVDGEYGAAGFTLAAALFKPLRTANRFGLLSRAAQFGLKPYSKLKRALRGTGLEAHHLIEKRFAGLMGQRPNGMLAVAVTETEHQAFTNAWRAAIPYGNGTQSATQQQVLDAARQIYRDYPAILNALGL